jgi:putative tricarboxylic transport membrane protein
VEQSRSPLSDQKKPEDAGAVRPDPPVLGNAGVDLVVSAALLALAALLGFDSWRTGNSWASDGPQAGYFPFYLSLVMGLASIYGFVSVLLRRDRGTFVTREQLGRVMMVLVPTIAFCLATQFLGIYVASFLLIAGFMWWVGRISVIVSLFVSIIFTVALFVTFEIAFQVIMPKGPLEAALGF